jgi:hypothetical protein
LVVVVLGVLVRRRYCRDPLELTVAEEEEEEHQLDIYKHQQFQDLLQ